MREHERANWSISYLTTLNEKSRKLDTIPFKYNICSWEIRAFWGRVKALIIAIAPSRDCPTIVVLEKFKKA